MKLNQSGSKELISMEYFIHCIFMQSVKHCGKYWFQSPEIKAFTGNICFKYRAVEKAGIGKIFQNSYNLNNR